MDALMAESLPWLEAERTRLRAAFDAGRFPHSLLLLATPGLGAGALAAWVAALTLCESSARRPCGACAACRLLGADSHPDLYMVRVEEDAHQIKVDQIRALIESLALRSYRGGFKVGIVEEAETLNANGANAFLKTLEEPTDRTVLMLIAAPSHRLPATIASRCLKVALRPPAEAVALEWLQAQGPLPAAAARAALALAGGAPLLARELDAPPMAALDEQMRADLAELGAGALDPTLVAERWLRADLALRLAWLENWITGRVRAAHGVANSRHSADLERLRGARGRPKIRNLLELLDALREFKRLGGRGVNQQLALEAMLLRGRAALSGTVGIA